MILFSRRFGMFPIDSCDNTSAGVHSHEPAAAGNGDPRCVPQNLSVCTASEVTDEGPCLCTIGAVPSQRLGKG